MSDEPPPLRPLPATATALTLRRDGRLSRDRTLLAGETPVARLRSDRWADGAHLTTADGAWRLARAGFWRRTSEILVASTGEQAGTATPHGFFGRTHDLTLEGRTLALSQTGGLRPRFALADAGGRALATIRRRRHSELQIERDDDLSAFTLGVACWLVLAILRGEDAATSSAATSAAATSA